MSFHLSRSFCNDKWSKELRQLSMDESVHQLIVEIGYIGIDESMRELNEMLLCSSMKIDYGIQFWTVECLLVCVFVLYAVPKQRKETKLIFFCSQNFDYNQNILDRSLCLTDQWPVSVWLFWGYLGFYYWQWLSKEIYHELASSLTFRDLELILMDTCIKFVFS